MSDAVGNLWQMQKDFTKDNDPLKQAVDSAFEIKKSKDTAAPTAPLPPATDPEAIAARDEAARRQRISASQMRNNPTGGLGDASMSGAVAKQLLGA